MPPYVDQRIFESSVVWYEIVCGSLLARAEDARLSFRLQALYELSPSLSR